MVPKDVAILPKLPYLSRNHVVHGHSNDGPVAGIPGSIEGQRGLPKANHHPALLRDEFPWQRGMDLDGFVVNAGVCFRSSKKISKVNFQSG